MKVLHSHVHICTYWVPHKNHEHISLYTLVYSYHPLDFVCSPLKKQKKKQYKLMVYILYNFCISFPNILQAQNL